MMGSTVRTTALTILALLVALAGCKGRMAGDGGSGHTETIAPAASKPAPTTPDAMTQTVDIEDSRTEAEGAGTSVDTAASATTTATAVQKKTGAAATSRKTPPSQSRPPSRTQ
jgi:hypothetical protein